MGFYRFVLATLVVIGHIDPLRTHPFNAISGPAAVNAFFFVSGFLMPMAYQVYYANYGALKGSLRFVFNRIIRIYPVYWISLLIILFDHSVFHVVNLADPNIYYHLASNLLLAYPGNDGYWLNSVAWSLNIEMKWYLLVPVLYCLIRFLLDNQRFSLRKSLVEGVLVMLIFVLLFLQSLYGGSSKSQFMDYALVFLAGCVLYFLFNAERSGKFKYFGLFSFFCGILLLFTHNLNVQTFTLSLLMLAVPILQNQIETRPSGLNKFFGDLSYPVFVLHGYIINSGYLKITSMTPRLDISLHVFLACLCMTAFATVFLFLVIYPLDRLRSSIKTKPGKALAF